MRPSKKSKPSRNRPWSPVRYARPSPCSKKCGCRELGSPQVAWTNVWSRDDNFASLLCWQTFASVTHNENIGPGHRAPTGRANIFPKLKGLSVQRWWPPLLQSGHTCSTPGLAESAQADERQFARRVFHRKKEIAECVEALPLKFLFDQAHLCKRRRRDPRGRAGISKRAIKHFRISHQIAADAEERASRGEAAIQIHHREIE
jgi:hypothetical protein